MCPYTNFELFRNRASLCHFQFFQKYLLRMRIDKRHQIFNKILNHCLNIHRIHQHAKNDHHTFLNKDTEAKKP